MSIVAEQQQNIFGQFKQLTPRYDADLQCMWYEMHASPRPCFTPALLEESSDFLEQLGYAIRSKQIAVSYLVLSSNVEGVFNLGGDLDLFRQHIGRQDREGLLDYAKACIDILYLNSAHLHLPLTTISLVQGSALGGGFEAALSSSVLIAEKGTEMGLPEILFNLFPGMGAYSLLSRKLDFRRAEELITAGRLFSAEELFELGVVDVLAEVGEGKQAVSQYIRRHRRASNGLQAISRVREYLNPLTYGELMDVANIWVDAALNLTSRDLRMMGKLVGAQNRLKPTKASPALALV